MSNILSETRVDGIKGIGPKKAAALGKLGIFTLRDVIFHYPRLYEDFRNVKKISQLADSEKALVIGRVLMIMPGRGWGRKRNVRILVEDESGRMEAMFFNAGYLASSFKQGDEYRFFGKVKSQNGRITMFQPVFSRSDDSADTGILPVYPLCSGITQKDMRMLSAKALEHIDAIEESLPQSVIKKANVCDLSFALSQLHFPTDNDKFAQARYRLIYEELFDLRAALILSKNRFGGGRKGRSVISDGADTFVSSLEYELTGAQKRVLSDVIADMADEKAMNRLVQGDVGSGKTVIAEAALAQAARAGLQGAFMAPTEILAQQHYENLSRDFAKHGISVELLCGSRSLSERKKICGRIASGETQIVVGTHALISEAVKFNDLGIVITDEQHRFGVNQRKSLAEKGMNPDVLVMTATPIPRTLAVILYGDLDISIIDEMPPGRKHIITKQFNEENRADAYELLINEIKNGRQAYIVAPFIENSESIDGWSAEALYESFSGEHPDIQCGLLHGSMDEKEKNAVMSDFYEGRIKVLISTVVIEVGINVPNASIMLIENTERFGLAQLHQLRGRVGRGEHQSYCLLVLHDTDNDIACERASIMCETDDGFVIADKDLEMRGPGELFGYRQHGLPQLVLADPVKHVKVADDAGNDAAELLQSDPSLSDEENLCLLKKIKDTYLVNETLIL